MAKITALLILILSINAFADAGEGKVTALKGSAQNFTAAGKVVALSEGALVHSGDRVKTSENSTLRIVFDEGVAAQVVANSDFLIEPPQKASNHGLSLNLIAGGIQSAVKKLQRPGAYQIRTKDAIMGVRGTVFYVGAPDAKKHKKTFLCPCNGKVTVKGKGIAETVFDGKNHDQPKSIGAKITKAASVDPHNDKDAKELMEMLN